MSETSNRRNTPCFIWSTGNDSVVPVENSRAFATALSRNQVQYDLRIYNVDENGLGLNTPSAGKEALQWMRRLEISVS